MTRSRARSAAGASPCAAASLRRCSPGAAARAAPKREDRRSCSGSSGRPRSMQPILDALREGAPGLDGADGAAHLAERAREDHRRDRVGQRARPVRDGLDLDAAHARLGRAHRLERRRRRPASPALRGWELCSIGDASYGLPWVLGTRALFYNKTLFARAGLDSTRPPETWDELRDAAAAIQKLGGGVHGYGVQAGERYVLFKKFMPFAWGNGGRDPVRRSARSRRSTRRANREALEFYLRLALGRACMDRQDVLDREFKEGRLGLQISGALAAQVDPAGRARAALRRGAGAAPGARSRHARVVRRRRGAGELQRVEAASRRRSSWRASWCGPRTRWRWRRRAKSVQPATVGADTAAYYREHPDEQLDDPAVRDRVPDAEPSGVGRHGGGDRGRGRAGAATTRRPRRRRSRTRSARSPELVAEALSDDARLLAGDRWAFLSPWIVAFALFGLYPFAFSLVASFTDYSPIRAGGAHFVGLANYARALARSGVLDGARQHRVLRGRHDPVHHRAGAGARRSRCSRRSAAAPSSASASSCRASSRWWCSSLVFKGLYAPDGALNGAARARSACRRRPGCSIPRTALPAIMAMDVWSASGYYMMIFLAGLEAIPRELYDAARLEGASCVGRARAHHAAAAAADAAVRAGRQHHAQPADLRRGVRHDARRPAAPHDHGGLLPLRAGVLPLRPRLRERGRLPAVRGDAGAGLASR